jgi:hypothetical protein
MGDLQEIDGATANLDIGNRVRRCSEQQLAVCRLGDESQIGPGDADGSARRSLAAVDASICSLSIR